MFKAENYITIQGWMRTELGLKGNDLMVYAIIYGFSQVENQMYTGNRQYLADWCGATKQGITKNLKHLEQMGVIGKHEQIINGVKFVAYYAKKTTDVEKDDDASETELPSGQHSLPGWATEFTGGGQLSCPNNIYIYTNDNSSSGSSTCACASDNPYGDGDVELRTDTVQHYASNNLQYMSPTAMQELNSFVDDLNDDIVRHAIDAACEQNIRTWAYTKAILNRYVDSGIKTVGEAKAADEKFKKGKQKQKPEEKPESKKAEDMTEEELQYALNHGPFGKFY